MPNTPGQSVQEKKQIESKEDLLEMLVRENLNLTKDILEHTKKTRRYILFAQIFNVIKVVLIVGPIILAILYLPPIIRDLLDTYSNLLGKGTGQTVFQGSDFINRIFESER